MNPDDTTHEQTPGMPPPLLAIPDDRRADGAAGASPSDRSPTARSPRRTSPTARARRAGAPARRRRPRARRDRRREHRPARRPRDRRAPRPADGVRGARARARRRPDPANAAADRHLDAAGRAAARGDARRPPAAGCRRAWPPAAACSRCSSPSASPRRCSPTTASASSRAFARATRRCCARARRRCRRSSSRCSSRSARRPSARTCASRTRAIPSRPPTAGRRLLERDVVARLALRGRGGRSSSPASASGTASRARARRPTTPPRRASRPARRPARAAPPRSGSRDQAPTESAAPGVYFLVSSAVFLLGIGVAYLLVEPVARGARAPPAQRRRDARPPRPAPRAARADVGSLVAQRAEIATTVANAKRQMRQEAVLHPEVAFLQRADEFPHLYGTWKHARRRRRSRPCPRSARPTRRRRTWRATAS